MDMKPLLYQMCAARLAQSNNPATAQILARMTGADGSAPPDLREMMEALAGQDPTMQILMQHLESMKAEREEAGVTIEGHVEDGERDPSEAAILELRSQVESMYRELSILRRRNEDLALALGACPHCWGEDGGCRSCRGHGAPGHARPDTEAFLHYVVPAGKTWRVFQSLDRNSPRARQPGAERAESAH